VTPTTKPRPREEYDRPWERMRQATDAELLADQRRHEDGEPFEKFEGFETEEGDDR
jgi:hypothetical protein